MQDRSRSLALVLFALASFFPLSFSQETKKLPSDVSTPTVNGIFIDPVPNAPFTGVLEVTSRQKLSDGSVNDLSTMNYVARDSVGRTYGEGRHFVADPYQGEPPLLSSHIYDPNTQLDTHLDPFTFIARQMKRTELKAAPGLVPMADPATASPPIKVEDLGTRMFDGVTLRGTRQSKAGGIVEEYWYSTDLDLYLIRKHIDPKWEQTFTLTKLDRSEPDPSRFMVPKGYRLADAVVTGTGSGSSQTAQVEGSGIYHVGGSVSAPRILHSEDPQYTAQARAAKITGICVLSLVLDSDGALQNIRVTKKLGYGLDEKAIEALHKYRFAPAMLNGKPVPVEINIDVNFKIY